MIEVPLFPLPNVVLFPRTLLPLHIFEPRYRQMVSDALEGNRRIGMVLQKAGGQSEHDWTLQLHSVGGLGQIRQVEELEDGKYNLILGGLSRFRIVRIVSDAPYKKALVELLDDRYDELPRDRDLAEQLVVRFRDLAGLGELEDRELEILEKSDLATLVNTICSAMQISPVNKQALLEVDDVRIRAEAARLVLTELLTQKDFVGKFSHLRPSDPRHN